MANTTTVQPVLSPYTSSDFNSAEVPEKKYITDFAVRCCNPRVDILTKFFMTAFGMMVDSNTADTTPGNLQNLVKLPNLKMHIYQSREQEYDIPIKAGRQYDVCLAADIPAVAAPTGPVTEVWSLATTVDPTGVLNDANFVGESAVIYLFDSSDPVNIICEQAYVVGRDTAAGTITVVRNADSANEPLPAWTTGAKIEIGEKAIPEIVDGCHFDCDPILKPCSEKNYIQRFTHCQCITKDFLARDVYLPFEDKYKDAYRDLMDGMIDQLTNSLWHNRGGLIPDPRNGSKLYMMNGQKEQRKDYTTINIEDCCANTFDEAMYTISKDTVSNQFDNTDIYLALCSEQAFRQLRNYYSNDQTLFRPVSDYQHTNPELWQIALTLGQEEVRVWAGSGIKILFFESIEMTKHYPYQIDLVNYGTLYFTTLQNRMLDWGGDKFEYGGLFRKVEANNPNQIGYDACELCFGYQGYFGMQQFCRSSNYTLKFAECAPTCEVPEVVLDENGNSGAINLP